MYIDVNTMRQVSMGNPDITNRYFKDMRRMETLTPDKQTELMQEYANTADEERRTKIRDAIMIANQPFIVSMARHISTGEDFNDLIDEGSLGLDKAIREFDATRDNKFLTFASYKVTDAMMSYTIRNRQVKPKNEKRVYAYADKYRNKFFTTYGWYPSEDELVDYLEEDGVVFSNKEDLYDITVNSLDAGFNNESVDMTEGTMWLDSICTTRLSDAYGVSNVSEHIENMTTKQLCNKALSYLSDYEKDIVCKYFGIGTRVWTAFELAQHMGFGDDTDKVRRRIKKYIQKIRKNGKVTTDIQ